MKALLTSALRHSARICPSQCVAASPFGSKVASRWIHSLAGNSLIRSSTPYLSTQRSSVCFFSTESQEGLVKILAREHAEELSSGPVDSMPTELADLHRKLKASWKIVDDGAFTRMYQTSAGLKVQVSFHCQDQVMDEMDEEEDEDDEEMARPVRFSVTVTKAGKTLVFTCLSEDAMLKIQSVVTTTEDAETVSRTGSIDKSRYQGPEFTELAEDLQDAFHDFLNEIGVDEDVAVFASMYSDFREELEYVKFLEDAQTVLRK